MREGYDIVSGWRKERKDPFFTRKIPSWIANWFISAITGVHLHDHGCTLKVYKKEAIKHINFYGEMHRFIPALASLNGVSITELPVRHHPRIYGNTKYGLSRTGKVVLDLLTVKFLLSFSANPIQFFGGLGFLLLFLSGISAAAVIVMKILKLYNITGNPLLYLAIFLGIIGVEFIIMGLLAEIMARIYHENKNHPTYIIKEMI